MRTAYALLGVLFILVIGAAAYFSGAPDAQKEAVPGTTTNTNTHNTMPDLTLTTDAFKNADTIPPKFTCDGENISPALSIGNVPPEAQSLVLIMDDPDVPTNIKPDGVYDHWVVFNIPPVTEYIEEGETPPGTLGQNSSGDNTYTGPCPPDAEHRYFFKLYALDTELDLPAGASKQEVEAAMDGHVLEEAVLMSRYERQ